jgi:hypothetical protein
MGEAVTSGRGTSRENSFAPKTSPSEGLADPLTASLKGHS